MKVEVLCTTMYQSGLDKYKEMNINTDVIFANQYNNYKYIENYINGNRVRMITTPYRGVGKNRNTALLYSNADILLFSDDDMVYFDNYKDNIIKAFEELPDADIIIFNIGSIGEKSTRRINNKIKKLNKFNILNYGFPRVAIKNSSIKKYNLWVSELFGGGSIYCSGEDNLFLINALNLGLKIYGHPFFIGNVKSGQSTWFNGFNEKYFFDNGAWLEATFPFFKYVFMLYFTFKFKRKSDIKIIKILKLQYYGMKAFKNGVSYDRWKKENFNSKQ